jgi:hypothetical protein
MNAPSLDGAFPFCPTTPCLHSPLLRQYQEHLAGSLMRSVTMAETLAPLLHRRKERSELPTTEEHPCHPADGVLRTDAAFGLGSPETKGTGPRTFRAMRHESNSVASCIQSHRICHRDLQSLEFGHCHPVLQRTLPLRPGSPCLPSTSLRQERKDPLRRLNGAALPI